MKSAWHVCDLLPLAFIGIGIVAALVGAKNFITWWDRRSTRQHREAAERRSTQANPRPQAEAAEHDPRRPQQPANDPNAEPLPRSRSGGNFWPEGIIPPEDRRP